MYHKVLQVEENVFILLLLNIININKNMINNLKS